MRVIGWHNYHNSVEASFPSTRVVAHERPEITIMASDALTRDFKWSRSTAMLPVIAGFLWMLPAVALLESGGAVYAGIWSLLALKWVFDFFWYRRVNYIRIGRDGVTVNRSPMRAPERIDWEDVVDVHQNGAKEVEIFLCEGRMARVSLLALEPEERGYLLTALRGAFARFRSEHSLHDRMHAERLKTLRRFRARAERFRRKGRYDAAEVLLGRVIELDPEDASAYQERGMVYYCRGLYDRAIAEYDRAIALRPVWAEPHFNRAVACERAMRRGEAIESYRNFLRFATVELVPYVRCAEDRLSLLDPDAWRD